MSSRNRTAAEMVSDDQFGGDIKHRLMELIHRVRFYVKSDDVALRPDNVVIRNRPNPEFLLDIVRHA